MNPILKWFGICLVFSAASALLLVWEDNPYVTLIGAMFVGFLGFLYGMAGEKAQRRWLLEKRGLDDLLGLRNALMQFSMLYAQKDAHGESAIMENAATVVEIAGELEENARPL